MPAKIIPLRHEQMARERLVSALGEVLAEQGFDGLDAEEVARRAKVSRATLFRHYQGLERLVEEFGASPEFWPTACELLDGEENSMRAMEPGELMSAFFTRYLEALLRRPRTLDILAWEGLTRSELTKRLEPARQRTALEFFEHMEKDPPEEVDLTALVILMAGAVHFLVVRSRNCKTLGGVDLQSAKGWERIRRTIDVVLRRTLDDHGLGTG